LNAYLFTEHQTNSVHHSHSLLNAYLFTEH